MDKIGTVLIKFSESEVRLLINSLSMTESIKVPAEVEWQKPYRTIRKDLVDILEELQERKREKRIDVKKEWREPIKFEANPKKEYINKITGKEGS